MPKSKAKKNKNKKIKRPAKTHKSGRRTSRPAKAKHKKAKSGRIKPVVVTEEKLSELVKRGRGRGFITESEIIQTFPNIEEDIMGIIQGMLPKATKEEMAHEVEKLIRAYDPCMSCASHFLKVQWDEK